jgi:hypothetical protein
MIVSVKNSIVLWFACVSCVFLCCGLCVSADEGPVGEWNLTAEFGGRTNESTLNVSKDGDDLKAMMVSQRGERELDDVTFADGELTFDMTFERQGQEMTLSFSGKIDGDQLDGNWSSDFGDFPVSGKRGGAKKGAVGTWKLMVDSPLGNNERQLVIKPDMSGSYGGGGDFPTFPIEKIKVDGDTATMDVTLAAQGTELDCTITLKFAGDKVTGSLDYGDGEAAIVGERGKSPIVGTWKLMVDSQLGENERELVINPDLSGTYGGGDFPEFPISNLKVDGDTATMDVTLDVQGQEIPATITLKLADGKVSGTLDYGQGEAEIEGKRQ